MAKTWVLDTQTKGTGATMVPLERVHTGPGARVPGFSFPELRPPEAAEPQPRGPLSFKVIDVSTRQTIADEVDARTVVQTLGHVASVVDVTVYAREAGSETWRLLTIPETRALRDLAARLSAEGPDDAAGPDGQPAGAPRAHS